MALGRTEAALASADVPIGRGETAPAALELVLAGSEPRAAGCSFGRIGLNIVRVEPGTPSIGVTGASARVRERWC